MSPMPTWAIVWLVVSLMTVVALLGVVIALVRHVMVLGRSAGRFRNEIVPVTEELSREAATASERAARLRRERQFGRS
jgi:hypothetical protein